MPFVLFGSSWFHFSAQGLDSQLGLVYHGGRYYDPAIAQALQPDPFGGVPHLPQTLNRYAVPTAGSVVARQRIAAAPQANPIFIAGRDTAAQTALGYVAGEAIKTAAGWGHLTIITSQSTWYRTIGQTSLNLRSLFQRGALQPQLGKTFRAYTTLGRVRTLGGGRYLAETGEIIETSGLPASAQVRFTPLVGSGLRIAAGGIAAFGISAAFQGLEDWSDPFLATEQRIWRSGISGAGGVGAWIIGLGATEIAAGAGAGSWAGPIGIIIGAGVTFIWITVVQPRVFETQGLNPKRDLAPLQD